MGVLHAWLSRKSNNGAGTYGLPGGHLEFGEDFAECARREVAEETGIHLLHVSYAWAINAIFDERTHYVTIFMRGAISEVCLYKRCV
jgi:8-oxo-dGTP diphosphatase